MENELIFYCLDIVNENIFQCLVHKGKSISFNEKLLKCLEFESHNFLIVKLVLIIKKIIIFKFKYVFLKIVFSYNLIKTT